MQSSLSRASSSEPSSISALQVAVQAEHGRVHERRPARVVARAELARREQRPIAGARVHARDVLVALFEREHDRLNPLRVAAVDVAARVDEQERDLGDRRGAPPGAARSRRSRRRGSCRRRPWSRSRPARGRRCAPPAGARSSRPDATEFTSAWPSTSSLTTFVRACFAAMTSAVAPSRRRSSGSAPPASSALTTSSCPSLAPMISAVAPARSTAFTVRAVREQRLHDALVAARGRAHERRLARLVGLVRRCARREQRLGEPGVFVRRGELQRRVSARTARVRVRAALQEEGHGFAAGRWRPHA